MTTTRTTAPPSAQSGRPPATLRAFYAAYLLSSIGTGTVVPFNVIFLSQVRGYSIGFVAAALATIMIVGIAVNPFAGALTDRRGPAAVSFAGASLQGAGWAVIGLAGTPWLTIVGAAVVGAGNGLFHSSLTPFFASAVGQAGMKAVSATRYWIMNVGSGTGAVIGGVLSLQNDLDLFLLLYVLNAASFVLLGVTMTLAIRNTPRPESRPAAKGGTWHAPYRDRTFRLLLAIQLLTTLFGFAQADSAVPLLVNTKLGQSLLVVGGLSALNTVVVIIAQLPLARLTRAVTETTLIKMVALVWAAAYLCGLAASALPAHGPRLVLLGCFAVVFAFGECLLSLALTPLVTRLAPADSLGRYSAAMSMGFASAFAAGPALGLLLVQHTPAVVFWAVMAAAAAVNLLVAVRLQARLASTAY